MSTLLSFPVPPPGPTLAFAVLLVARARRAIPLVFAAHPHANQDRTFETLRALVHDVHVGCDIDNSIWRKNKDRIGKGDCQCLLKLKFKSGMLHYG